MSLHKCDVTGSTDRVHYLPLYMQTDKIKKVCFRVAVKMEKERLAKLANPAKVEKPEVKPEVKAEAKAEQPKKARKPKAKK